VRLLTVDGAVRQVRHAAVGLVVVWKKGKKRFKIWGLHTHVLIFKIPVAKNMSLSLGIKSILQIK
jgi:hypothetical protein